MLASAAPMNLSDAVSYALDHNPTVAQQRASVASNELAVAKQKTVAFPTVSGSLSNYSQKSGNYQGSYAAIGATQQSIFSQNTAQIGTNYTLQTGGLALLQLAAAKAQLEQSRETLASTENQIATTVASAYYGVVAKRAIVALDQSDLSYQQVLVRVAQVKEKAGVVAGVDVLKAQVAQAKSSSTLVAAQADVMTAREQLALAIGAPLDTEFAFSDNIAEPALPNGTVDTLQDIALRSRPDILAARDTLASAQATRKSWGRQLYPSVQIGAAFGNQYVPTTPASQTQINPAVLKDPTQPLYLTFLIPRGAPGFWNISAQTTFTLPFVDYGARHFDRKNDDAQIALAQSNLDQAALQARADVRQAYRNAQTALAQLAYARDEARLGAESSRIAELQYEHGLIALSDVLQTQQQTVIAQNDLVNARVAYVNAIVKLRTSLGIFDAKSAVADLR